MVPYATFDGDTGYVVFNWGISQYNDGDGKYRIEAFIGGDPTHGIPTGKYTIVKVKDGKEKVGSIESEEETENIGEAINKGEVIEKGTVIIQGEIVRKHFSIVSILRKLFGI